jgi:uncharacterized damage-inducible protein DinB
MAWTAPTPAPVDGPVTGDDRPMLEGYLAWQRSTLLNICAGLTAEQLAERAVPPSNLSLLGLVRHLTKVERIWFRIRAAHEDIAPVYDPALPKDTDFEDLDPARAPDELAQYVEECRLADAAAAGLPWDHPVESRDDTWSLRFVYVHMVGEYARHNGHADLLRERVDGTTGR